MLALYGVPLVLLAKQMAVPLDAMVFKLGAPPALGGFVMAVLVLTPESISAIRAALGEPPPALVNILLGSVLASIGLTIPLVIAVSLSTGPRAGARLDPGSTVLLVLSLVTSILTFTLPRTNLLLGSVHLLLFGRHYSCSCSIAERLCFMHRGNNRLGKAANCLPTSTFQMVLSDPWEPSWSQFLPTHIKWQYQMPYRNGIA